MIILRSQFHIIICAITVAPCGNHHQWGENLVPLNMFMITCSYKKIYIQKTLCYLLWRTTTILFQPRHAYIVSIWSSRIWMIPTDGHRQYNLIDRKWWELWWRYKRFWTLIIFCWSFDHTPFILYIYQGAKIKDIAPKFS